MIRCKFSFSRKPVSLAAALAAFALGSAGAQEAARPAANPQQAISETAEQKAQREQDLKKLQEAMAASAEARKRLEAEVDAIRTDRAKLNSALIETAQRVRSAEDRAHDLEQRLQT